MKNTESRPFFSVIMACYNVESYIDKAIRSVLSQTINDWELVIVDDASSDKTYEKALHYKNTDRQIKVLRLKTNCGAGHARNVAVEVANGNWLAILDADDEYLASKLERQRDFILSNSDLNLVLVGTGVKHIFWDDQRPKTYKYPNCSVRLKKNLYYLNKFPPHSSIVYRTRTFKEVGGFNRRFLRAQDFELCLRLSEKGEFACLEMPLVQFRVRPDSISKKACPNGFSQPMYGVAAHVNFRVLKYGLPSPSYNDESFKKLMEITRLSYLGSRFEEANLSLLKIKYLLQKRKYFEATKRLFSKPTLFFWIISKKISIYLFFNAIFQQYIRQNKIIPSKNDC